MSLIIQTKIARLQQAENYSSWKLVFLSGVTALVSLQLLCATMAFAAGGTVVQASGDITAAVQQCRSLLGDPLNGVGTGEKNAGRREINWDGVPAQFTNVDTFPPNFFNVNSPRGALFSTPGGGFRVSDTRFADLNPTYGSQFSPFSPNKTFAVVGSNTMDVTFQVAGSTTPAAVTGFCVVFSDVDLLNSARIELFQGNESIDVLEAPIHSDASTLSLIGVVYPSPRITRVRITSGQGILSAANGDLSDGGTLDLVVMDDFLYGEPHPNTDLDGVIDANDFFAPSDLRTKVDLIRIDALLHTALDNVTLESGHTLQDLVNGCRDNDRKQFRRCIDSAAARASSLTGTSAEHIAAIKTLKRQVKGFSSKRRKH